MRITLLILLFSTISSCSSLGPVTWEKRVVDNYHLPRVNLFYTEKGKGQTLLLVHGLAESSYTWRYIIDDLAKNNHVIAVDLKGFGRSPKPRDALYSVYDQALAVHQLMQQKNIKQATVIGHSFGGGVALALAMMDKPSEHVKQLILIDAAAYPQELPSMLRILQRPLLGVTGLYLMSPVIQAKKAYQYAFYDAEKIPSEGVNEASINLGKQGSRYALAQTVQQMIPDDLADISKKYKLLSHRALIIWGEKDKIVLPENAHRLHKDIKNSQLVFLEKVGHIPQEEAPKKILNIIEKFIK
ncbi:MAG TPA: alpha/beta hydrolase [Thiotrichaceae bacterium]|nr:alpha/beta hydrolase [Thiotrichaceae bacterium]